MNASKLSVGMYGDEVKTLHDRLRQHGIELPASEVERAFFGPGTRHAVQQYQAARGLPVSGEVDERTGATFSAAPAPPQVAPLPSVSLSNPTRPIHTPLVSRSPAMPPATDGTRTPSVLPIIPVSPQDIRDLQVSLRASGIAVPQHEYDEHAFGPGTRDAVLALQSRY